MNAAIFDGATDGNALQDQMKQGLHVGDSRTLNVYSTSLRANPPWLPPGRFLLGYATFPWNYASAPWNDGVVITYTSIPGTSISGGTQYGQGKVGSSLRVK